MVFLQDIIRSNRKRNSINNWISVVYNIYNFLCIFQIKIISFTSFQFPLIYGLYVGISETIQRALISKYVSPQNRGTAFGFYGLIVGMCHLIGNITFGFLWDNYDINIALLYSISLSTLAIIFMFGL